MIERNLSANDLANELSESVVAGRFRDVLETYAGMENGRRDDPVVQLCTATAAAALGDLKLGFSLVDEALTTFRNQEDHYGLIRALNLIGGIMFENGRIREAEFYFHEALDLAREFEDRIMVARVTNNLASVTDIRGDTGLAYRQYMSALNEYQQLANLRGLAETYHNLGMLFRQIGSWDKAFEATDEAIRYATVVGEPTLLSLVLTGRAELDREQGQPEIAERELTRAARLAQGVGDDLGHADTLRLRAVLALDEGDAPRAYDQSELARVAARDRGSALLEAECIAVSACALKQLGRAEAAERIWSRAVERFHAIGAIRLLERFDRVWSKSA
jgi:tetratricopeptide (TPR) repeat protein